MYRSLLTLLLLGLLVFSFSQQDPSGLPDKLDAYRQADSLYNKSELLLRGDVTEDIEEKVIELYNRALAGYQHALAAPGQAMNDSMRFFAHLHRGLIEHYLDSLPAAKQDYLSAIRLKRSLPQIPDSFLFKPNLFTGSIYYFDNNVDSAQFYYKQAESILEHSPARLSESQRLYNLSGVLYYEAGNYRQARNYFEKAIASLTSTDRYYRELYVNYHINIASMLVKLEEYDEADAVYEKILPYGLNENEIYQNRGIIELRRGNAGLALQYFRKVDYGDSRKNIELFLNRGMAFAELGLADSSRYYTREALAVNKKWNAGKPNTSNGLILKFQGDQLEKDGQHELAITKYQEAIRQLVPGFSSLDLSKNPDDFSGVYSYIQLFRLLIAKAEAFENWYRQAGDSTRLEKALGSYEKAYALSHYVGRTYNSDEARLFLNKLKYLVHERPIRIGIQLFELTKDRLYLEKAYEFDQRNKASVLLYNLQENESRKSVTSGTELYQEEDRAKSNITRLALRIAQVSDSSQLVSLREQVRDLEIRLGRIQETISLLPGKNATPEQIPSIASLQDKLDKQSAIISYHVSDTSLLMLLISKQDFTYRAVTLSPSFLSTLDSLKKSLQEVGGEEGFNGGTSSQSLYQFLIQPLQSSLVGMERLIVIPDDELNYLPFEALQDGNGDYLIRHFSVLYQYSTALLDNSKKTQGGQKTLAFAPYATQSYHDSSGMTMSSLPASGKEIEGLKGVSYVDAAATKQRFLQSLNRYPIIHLATHALADNENPLRSYISFYPGVTDFKLYAGEIYNLRLDTVQLIILSACETGTGQLVKGEGLMSLSRAFAYAGCPNILTSLWKAEDETTAFLMNRLHHYLEDGLPRDQSLRKAKLDLLESTIISPRLKSPNYWAHLLLIGNYQPGSANLYGWWIVAGILLVLLFLYWMKKRKPSPNKPNRVAI